MNENNLSPRKRKYSKGITVSDKEAQKSENLIKQNFTAQKPDEKWLTDITQVQCYDGKLYISAILDCWNAQIIALKMDDNMRKELCIETVKSAMRYRDVRGVILHSDRGSQYTSKEYREVLGDLEIQQSMSGTGKCYDNARMESFFATLKKEKLNKKETHQMTMGEVKTIVFGYIMGYYNRDRIHTSNPEGLSPVQYRESQKVKKEVA
jgi:transposase InsO family protein